MGILHEFRDFLLRGNVVDLGEIRDLLKAERVR